MLELTVGALSFSPSNPVSHVYEPSPALEVGTLERTALFGQSVWLLQTPRHFLAFFHTSRMTLHALSELSGLFRAGTHSLSLAFLLTKEC